MQAGPGPAAGMERTPGAVPEGPDREFPTTPQRANEQTSKLDSEADLFGEGSAEEPSRCDVHRRFLSYAEGLAGLCSWCHPDAYRSLRGRDRARHG